LCERLGIRVRALRADVARGAKDDTLLAAQKNRERFAFHRRVKAADDSDALSPQVLRQVVGLQDEITRAANRREQGETGTSEEVKVAKRGDLRGRIVAQKCSQRGRVVHIRLRELEDFHSSCRAHSEYFALKGWRVDKATRTQGLFAKVDEQDEFLIALSHVEQTLFRILGANCLCRFGFEQ